MSYKRAFILDYSADVNKYGLHIHCDLYNEEGQRQDSALTKRIKEVINGVYLITISNIPEDFRGGLFLFYETQPDASTSSSSSEDNPFGYLASYAINPEECEYIKALYHSEIDYIVDDDAGVDRWTVALFKNGMHLSLLEVTSPSLVVFDEAGVLKFSQSLTQLGSTRFLKYYASGAERGNPGENLSAETFATIDGEIRFFPRIHGRDS